MRKRMIYLLLVSVLFLNAAALFAKVKRHVIKDTYLILKNYGISWEASFAAQAVEQRDIEKILAVSSYVAHLKKSAKLDHPIEYLVGVYLASIESGNRLINQFFNSTGGVEVLCSILFKEAAENYPSSSRVYARVIREVIEEHDRRAAKSGWNANEGWRRINFSKLKTAFRRDISAKLLKEIKVIADMIGEDRSFRDKFFSEIILFYMDPNERNFDNVVKHISALVEENGDAYIAFIDLFIRLSPSLGEKVAQRSIAASLF